VPEESPVLRLLLFSFFPLLAGGLILAHLVPDTLIVIAHCPLREATGVPCPTCGSTLAATGLASGHWGAALRANPLVVVLGGLYILAAVYAGLATVLPRWRRSLQLSAREKRTARWLAVSVILVNWIYLGFRYLG